jgi:peptidoglycan/LPS O-acetylase OafA/YrhL
MRYQPALDGIRGVAILGVVLLHSSIWGAMPEVVPGGNLGVTVFFVLSGYLITTMLLREHGATGRIDQRAFYARRAARLLPAMLVLLPVYVLIFSRAQSAAQLALTVGPTLLYLSSFVQAIWGAMGNLGWTWSLSVEEQFYALWPPVLGWLLGGGRERRAGLRGSLRRHPLALAACLATALVVIATGIRLDVVGSVRSNEFAYYSSFTRMDALAIGCLTALVGHRLLRPLPPAAAWAALAVIVWCYLNPAFGVGTAALDVYGLPLCTVAAAVLTLAVVNRPAGWMARLLSWRPLVHVGAISYGLYLWNLLPGQTFHLVSGRHAGTVGTIELALVMVAVVELSHWCVERPVMHWCRARLDEGGSGGARVSPAGAAARG